MWIAAIYDQCVSLEIVFEVCTFFACEFGAAMIYDLVLKLFLKSALFLLANLGSYNWWISRKL